MSNKKPESKKPTINQDKLMSFALGELAKVFEDMKAGKEIKMPQSLEILQEELHKTNDKMTDEELEEWVKNLNKKIDGQ